MKRKYIFTAVLLAALTAAGFGITVLCGSGGSGSHGKSSGSTQTEGKADDSDARTEDAAVGNREDGDAAISSKTDGNDTFNVVTSFYPVYIAAKNVIGDVEGVELHNLTEPQTGCLHDYQLTPQDMISLSHADLFLVNGGGIESFLSDVFTSYPELPVAEASEGIDFLETVDGQVYDAHDAGNGTTAGSAHEYDVHDEGDTEGHDHAEDTDVHESEDGHVHDHTHDHGDVNAHVWMDVGRYEVYVENIAQALSDNDPAHRETYEANAAAYEARLETLHQELETLRGRADGEKIILFHDAFAYFADMTGMDISYVIDMDENTSLSAREVSEIVDLVKQENIDLLFTEEQYGTKLADAVSRETDARVYVLDSLVSGNYDADSYITGMEKNLETLQQAFQEIETGKEESK